MTTTLILWIIATLLLMSFTALALVSLVHTRLRYPRWISRLPVPAAELTVNIFVPCQENTEFLEGNLRAMAEQDHGAFTLSMVTDNGTDPAVSVIRRITAEYPWARHVVAGYAKTLCSQQNHVQATAMAADRKSDILVKVDSDMRPSPGWLRELVRPFADPDVAATSSHHWISPPRPGFVNGCYTVFAAWLTTLMGLPGLSWTWGGCYAVRRSVFVEMDIAGLWRGTGTDDTTLRNRLVDAGHRIVFVPEGEAPSYETHEDLGGLVRWISRQAYHGKIYVRGAWAVILAAETILCLATAGAAALLVAGVVTNALQPLAAPATVILLSTPVTGLILKLMRGMRRDLPAAWWPFLAFAVHFVSWYAVLRTLSMRSLPWRGHIYVFNPDGTVRSMTRTASDGATSAEMEGRPAAG